MRDNLSVNVPLLEKIGIHAAAVTVGGWRLKGLGRSFLFLFCSRVFHALSAVQQERYRLRIAESAEGLQEGNGPAAPLGLVVVPSVPPNGHAVVAGHALLAARADELLTAYTQELLQVDRGGTVLLFLGKMNIRH